MWIELHNHSQFSLFDGFGSPSEIVKYAKEVGMKAVAITDHGNMLAMGELYLEAKKQEIKPILGIEAYFQPKFDKEKSRYHLNLFATSLKGYQNLSKIVSQGNMEKFYRRMTVDFELLEKYSEDIICSSACVAGIVPGALMDNKYMRAKKAANKFKQIFGDNFYFEIMPIPIDEKGTQERVNRELYKLGKELNIKCIPTTDSHYTRKEDFESYRVMRMLNESGYKYFNENYSERYMHTKKDIIKKLRKNFKDSEIKDMLRNITEIYNKIEDFDLKSYFKTSILKSIDTDTPYEDIKKECISELKRLDLWNNEYKSRLKFELEVIKEQQLSDYFCIVSDYVKYAIEQDVYVGPGRGSVCASLVAFLLKITKVDPILIGNDFQRFIRKDRPKMPDIDLDFEQGERDKVINYLLEKYKGKAVQIITSGMYKTFNTCNDLGKLFEMEKDDVAAMKKQLGKIIGDEGHYNLSNIEYKSLLQNKVLREIDEKYYRSIHNVVITNPIKHFSKLYGHIRYFGTHPAGVVITNDDIGKFIPVMKIGDKYVASLDKDRVGDLGLLKFDVLGLITMNMIHDMERITKDKYQFDKCPIETKKEMYKYFAAGETTGIFQFNKTTAKQILIDMKADNLNDLIAATSLNRPGPLKLKMHEAYAINKHNPNTKNLWYNDTADAYGTIIYQEHVMRICTNLAGMTIDEAFTIIKFNFTDEEREQLKQKFAEGIVKRNLGKITLDAGLDLFESMVNYLFNKGHGSGYAMISEWQMYHRVKYPSVYWVSVLKYNNEDNRTNEYKRAAIREGQVIFLSHINYSQERYSLREFDGEYVIQEGLTEIKGLGMKAAQTIIKERNDNGDFIDLDDLEERCKGRTVTAGVIRVLKEYGADEMNEGRYISRVTKYNSRMYV